MSGKKRKRAAASPPPVMLTVDDFKKAAKARLSKMAYDYYRSGADAERTLRENRRAFERQPIWPRVLVDASRPVLATKVLGTEVSAPILVAPTAYHQLAHPEAELATARAAQARGILYVQSTLSNRSIEEVAAASSGPKWFQLYVHKDRGVTRSLVERAHSAGHKAIVLTVDTPVLGRRLRDERNGFALPDGLRMANFMGYDGLDENASGSALAAWFAARHDPTLSWRDLDWLQSLSPLPLVLKGILRRGDAARAVEHGVQGIIVSNHGARQLDGVPATLDALPGVIAAVDGRCEVLLDGGVRWGSDVLKALLLGARAVLVGRPILWGLAADGQAGVERVLEILAGELARAQCLSGNPSLNNEDSSPHSTVI